VSSDINRNQADGGASSGRSKDESQASVLNILGVIQRRKWLIFFGIVVGVGLGSLYFFQATRIYESTVEILVVPKDARISTTDRNQGADYQQRSADEDILATQMQMFASPRVIKQALFGLNKYGEKPDETQTNADKPEANVTRDLTKELQSLKDAIENEWDPVEYVIENLTVTRGGKGKAISASVLGASLKTPSAHDSAVILQNIVNSYQLFLTDTFETTGIQAIEVIQLTEKKLKKDLEDAEEAYVQFRQDAPLTWNGQDSLNLFQERLRKTEAALGEIEARRAEAASRLQVIQETMDEKGVDGLTDLEKLALLSGTEIGRLELLLKATGEEDLAVYRTENPELVQTAETQYQRLLSLMLEETQLLEDFGSDHPKVLAIREQIKLIHKFLEDNEVKLAKDDPERLSPGDLLEAHIGLLKHDLSEMTKRETELEAIKIRAEKEAKSLAQARGRQRTEEPGTGSAQRAVRRGCGPGAELGIGQRLWWLPDRGHFASARGGGAVFADLGIDAGRGRVPGNLPR
jgi:succinoglycan biosynthesis transport protein ExoP